MKNRWTALALLALLALSSCGTAPDTRTVASHPTPSSNIPQTTHASSALRTPSSSASISPESISQEEALFDSPQMWESPFPKALCRGWHAHPTMPSSVSTLFLFTSDGTFYYAASTLAGVERTRYMDGDWFYEDGFLHLTIKRKIRLEDGVEVDGWGSMVNDIEGGYYVKYELQPSEYEYLRYDVQVADPFSGAGEHFPNEVVHMVSITIADLQFWGFLQTDAPYMQSLPLMWDDAWER